MSASTCLAYREDGTLCRALASILDHQQGVMVCLQHVPADVAEEITLDINMGTVEGRIDHDGEVYSWHLEESEAFDTYHCPTHGPRRYSRGEVRQAERDETCLYVCTLCDQVADPTPLEGGHDGLSPRMARCHDLAAARRAFSRRPSIEAGNPRAMPPGQAYDC